QSSNGAKSTPAAVAPCGLSLNAMVAGLSSVTATLRAAATSSMPNGCAPAAELMPSSTQSAAARRISMRESLRLQSSVKTAATGIVRVALQRTLIGRIAAPRREETARRGRLARLRLGLLRLRRVLIAPCAEEAAAKRLPALIVVAVIAGIAVIRPGRSLLAAQIGFFVRQHAVLRVSDTAVAADAEVLDEIAAAAALEIAAVVLDRQIDELALRLGRRPGERRLGGDVVGPHIVDDRLEDGQRHPGAVDAAERVPFAVVVV